MGEEMKGERGKAKGRPEKTIPGVRLSSLKNARFAVRTIVLALQGNVA
jgi:hypothetical protein